MKRYSILSLDFDYFPVVTSDLISKCYPDPLDLSPQLSELVWASKYAQFSEELLQIEVNMEEISIAKQILSRQNKEIPVMIALSHVSIYNFIHQLQQGGKPLNIVNADTHHDYFNDNPQVDCGNWLSFIMEEYPKSKWEWVVNPISLDTYDAHELQPYVKESLKELENRQFDAIFLCRSDNWSPPHLDTAFFDLVRQLKSFQTVEIQRGLCIRKQWVKDTQQIKRIENMKGT